MSGLHAERELLENVCGLVFPDDPGSKASCRDCGEQGLERGLQKVLRGPEKELLHPYCQSSGQVEGRAGHPETLV